LFQDTTFGSTILLRSYLFSNYRYKSHPFFEMSKVVPSAFEAYQVNLTLEGWRGLRQEMVNAVKTHPSLLYGPGHGNPKKRSGLFDSWLNKWLHEGAVQKYFCHESGTTLVWDRVSDRKVYVCPFN
jgi:hypothetical protein